MTSTKPATSADVVAALRTLSLALGRWRPTFARRHGLSDNDAIVVLHLDSAGGRLLPRELCARMSVPTGTLTPMLDRLERAGFVHRVPNPTDRRSVYVDLTDAGALAVQESHDLLARQIGRNVARAGRTDLVDLLAQLTTSVSETVRRLSE